MQRNLIRMHGSYKFMGFGQVGKEICAFTLHDVGAAWNITEAN
jgi:hypothetical protein